MAEEDGLAVDVPGYEVAMEAAREKSRAGMYGSHSSLAQAEGLCVLLKACSRPSSAR